MFKCDASEIEALAVKAYGMTEYNFASCEESGNDSSHEFTVTNRVDRTEQDDWDDAVQSKGASLRYNTYLLLDRLCSDGHLDEGEYVVRVSW